MDRDLKSDLRFSINNPNCSDVIFICKDGTKKHAYRSILALRSDMFNSMLFGNMIESKSKEISLPSTSSVQLQAIFEYCYTDDTPSLTLDNAVEVFLAAEFFLLPRLQQFIVNHIGANLKDYDTAGIILSDAVKIAESSSMKYVLIATVRNYFLAKPLGYGTLRSLSKEGLEAVLSDQAAVSAGPTDAYTWLLCIVDWACDVIGDDKITETQRHGILSALDVDGKLGKLGKVSSDPFHEMCNDMQRQLEEMIFPFLWLVHFDQICSHRLVTIMDVLGFVPTDILCKAFRRNVLENKVCGPSWCHGNGCVWDHDHVGSSLRLSFNATVVEYHPDKNAQNFHQSVTCASPLTGDSIYEWDVVVHAVNQGNGGVALGIATKEIITDQNYMLGMQANTWGFASSGGVYNSNPFSFANLGGGFGQGSVVTFKVDMKERSCAISVNGRYHGVVWKNLPDIIYPAASVTFGSRCEIRPSQKKVVLFNANSPR